jgi:outer membrane protein OmpA-like peptidoglycan-associated protein
MIKKVKRLGNVLVLLIVLFSVATLNAQSAKIQRGIDKYNFQEYAEAITLFKKVLEANDSSTSAQAIRYLAFSYREIKDYPNAELYFGKLVNTTKVNAEDYLYYGQALKANGKLEQAREQIEIFAEQEKNQFLASLLLQSFDNIQEWDKEPVRYSIAAQDEWNTSSSEFGLQLFKDIYYISSNRQADHNSPEEFTWNNTPFLSIFEQDKKEGDEDFVEARGRLNTEYHDGPLAIDEASQRAIITRVNNQLGGKEFVNRMKLYEGSYKRNRWSGFEQLPFNSDDYSVAHASYADSNTIYFASDMPGGQGGMDLYLSRRIEGKWEAPQNLGSTINSKGNEVFPHWYKGELYFASDGYSGYGGLDLYVAEKENDWLSPQNLKSPLNSNRDDFGIYFTSDTTGYFSSNRQGGKGEDDIYSFFRSKTYETVYVNGVFEYKGLPVEGVKVFVKDGNDSLVAYSYTDPKGRFFFRDLPYQQDFFFEIEAEDSEMVEGGRLYLTDLDGDKIKLIQRLKDGKFKFRALPPDEVEALELLSLNEDAVPEGLLFEGMVFKKIPGDYKDELMVYLVNDKGEIIDSVLTDKRGSFRFRKLDLDTDQNYFVQLKETEDDMILALSNQQGRIYKLSEKENGLYSLEAELDPSVNKVITANHGITGVIARLEHEGVPLAFTKVDIYDKDNRLVATVFTNEKGEFQYNKLGIDESYYFKLSTLDPEMVEDARIYIASQEGDPLYLIKQLKDGKFSFKALPFDEYQDLQLIEESLVPDLVAFNGQLYRKLPGDAGKKLKVYILDEEGEIIDSTYTDKYGKFRFERLSPDETYAFKVEGEEEVNMLLLDDQDQVVEQALLNEKGEFTYQKLTYQVASFTKVALEEEDTFAGFEQWEEQFAGVINGQVYRKLLGDFGEGNKIFLLDEFGNVIDSAIVDEKGNFSFRRLDTDRNYTFRLEEAEDAQLLFLTEGGATIEKAFINDRGDFAYKKLTYEIANLEATEEEDVPFQDIPLELQADTVLYGQVFEQRPGDIKETMLVKVYNKGGTLLDSSITDQFGQFKMQQIKPSREYRFEIVDPRDHFQLITLNEKGEVTAKLVKNRNGEFTYYPLGMDAFELSLEQEKKEPIIIESQTSLDTFVVYYRFDSTLLNTAAKMELNKFLEIIRGKVFTVEVQSHTDNRGPKTYNELLSKQRTNAVVSYLLKKGVNAEQISGKYFGEMKPAIDCAIQECGNKEHALNRRTELKLKIVTSSP